MNDWKEKGACEGTVILRPGCQAEMRNFGHYNSVRHELLQVATGGSCLPGNKPLPGSVAQFEREATHAAEPEGFQELIDGLYFPRKGTIDRIEMFTRGSIPQHWKSWGNEAGKGNQMDLFGKTTRLVNRVIFKDESDSRALVMFRRGGFVYLSPSKNWR